MRPMYFLILLGICSCHKAAIEDKSAELMSIQVVDRNGFAETVSGKDRLQRYSHVNFDQPQPYQKVLRVFGKNQEGQSSSKMTSYHPNGYLWQCLEIMEGRAHGLYQEWYASGKKKMEFHVMEGAPDLAEAAIATWVFDGINRVWEENGSLIAEIRYQKGVLEGDSVYYYPEGPLQKRVPYTQDRLEGVFTVFSPAGVVIEEIPYRADQPEGRAYACLESGELLYEENFLEGQLVEARYWYQGTPIAEIVGGYGRKVEFVGGIPCGYIEYQKGKPEGSVETYSAEGILLSRYGQKEGKKQGEEVLFYADGKTPKISLEWKEDVLQGSVKTFFPTGRQESQKEMYQNKKNGECFAWYATGELMLHEEYENDQLVAGSYYKKKEAKAVSRITAGKGIATLYDPEGYFLRKVSYEKGLPLLESEGRP